VPEALKNVFPDDGRLLTEQKEAPKVRTRMKRPKTTKYIMAHVLTPAGVVTSCPVPKHNRFVHDKAVYEVRNVFTGTEGDRIMLISKGNPIPQPAGDATSADAMESQFVETTIKDLSRPTGPGLGGVFDQLMDKLRRIPPAIIVLIIVGCVLLFNFLAG
jgi:hypothetical protein